MIYKCILCNKTFNRKSNYDAHLNRKYKCNRNKDVIINTENTVNQLNQNVNQNVNQVNQNAQNINQNVNQVNQNNNNCYKCLFCNKKYLSIQALSRHKKNHLNIQNDDVSYDELLEENKKIKKTLEENKKIKEEMIALKQEINELKENNINCVSKSKNTKNNNSHNTSNTANNTLTNSSNNTANIGTLNNNNTIQNFIINKPTIRTANFGEEDLSLIPEIEKLIALKGQNDAFINYLTLVNFNEKLPQNHNLSYSNTRSNIASIVENNILVAKPIKDILATVVTTRLSEVEELMIKFKSQKLLTHFESQTLKNTIDFLKNAYFETEDVDGNTVKADKEMARKLKDYYEKIKLTIYNGKEMVNKSITAFLFEPLFDPLLEPINKLIN